MNAEETRKYELMVRAIREGIHPELKKLGDQVLDAHSRLDRHEFAVRISALIGGPLMAALMSLLIWNTNRAQSAIDKNQEATIEAINLSRAAIKDSESTRRELTRLVDMVVQQQKPRGQP